MGMHWYCNGYVRYWSLVYFLFCNFNLSVLASFVYLIVCMLVSPIFTSILHFFI